MREIENNTKSSSSLQEGLEHELEMNRRMREADMDSWYPSLSDVTYPTLYIPLSVREAECMIDAHRSIQQGTERSESVNEVLSELIEKVDEKIVELNALGDKGDVGVFAKLASRSPKDATNRFDVKCRLIKDYLDKAKDKSGKDQLSKNEIVKWIYQAHISSFRLYSGAEVIETLLHSYRVVMDELVLVLEHKEKVWKEQIFLRQWWDVPIHFEFRGFIYGNELTALCQYYDGVYYEDVIHQEETIEKLIKDFFEEIKDRVPIEPEGICYGFCG